MILVALRKTKASRSPGKVRKFCVVLILNSKNKPQVFVLNYRTFSTITSETFRKIF